MATPIITYTSESWISSKQITVVKMKAIEIKLPKNINFMQK